MVKGDRPDEDDSMPQKPLTDVKVKVFDRSDINEIEKVKSKPLYSSEITSNDMIIKSIPLDYDAMRETEKIRYRPIYCKDITASETFKSNPFD